MAASTNFPAIAASADPSITRACFSRSAWACRDIASCKATGIAPSRISTDSTEMPQSAVLRPISPRNSSSAALCSDKSADNIDDPIISRSEVLGDPIDGFAVIGDVQSRLLRVVDETEDDRVDVQREGIFRQRLSALKPVV